MKQSATQAPLLHTSPAAHAVPLGSLDQARRGGRGRADLAGVGGVHRARRVQRAADEAIGDAGAAAAHLAGAHAVPLGSLDHAVVEVAGVQTWQALPGFTVPAA